MRIVPNKNLLVISAFLLSFTPTFADEPAPPPPTLPPPPPGLPIDNGILILILISVIYGFYKIVKSNEIKKASN